MAIQRYSPEEEQKIIKDCVRAAGDTKNTICDCLKQGIEYKSKPKRQKSTGGKNE
jgi:hypothetical protein